MPLIRSAVPDVLSEVLALARLRGEVYSRTEATAPWGITFPPDQAHFHVVERGAVCVTISGAKPIEAAAGDLVVIPGGTGHTIGDRRGRRGVPLEKVLATGLDREQAVIRLGGGGGAETRLVCGTFVYAPGTRESLLGVLPPVLHVRGRPDWPIEWLDVVLRMLAAEAKGGRPGSELAAARLVDLIFVHAVRAWLETLPEGEGGWLGALRDPRVGEAIRRLHAEPARDWTLDSLAAAVKWSRSPLAARFAALVGEPPIAYLTRWRMQLAARELETGRASVAEVARGVGYASEAAFSRVFKRFQGVPPSQFRRRAAEPRS